MLTIDMDRFNDHLRNPHRVELSVNDEYIYCLSQEDCKRLIRLLLAGLLDFGQVPPGDEKYAKYLDETSKGMAHG